ncbi:MAG: PIN domain-containing protein [Gammaproteobacteria bacterium]|nr:PIN domain-containing protein [Gammaproteobacteria bacterium]
MKTVAEQLQTHIRSEMLGDLRKIEGMKNLLGHLAQFNVVVDANIILGDLIWLVGKRKNPEATTELVECINAGTIVAYVARPVLAEVDEHIATIATAKKLPEDALRREWKSYRKLLKLRTPSKALVDRYKEGQDPDDAPTIALAKMIRADGILSKDSDVVAMGGLVIELDFTNHARDYSRKTAVAVTIRCSGGIVLIVSWASIEIILKSAVGCVAWFRSLPASVQIILLFAVVAVASNKNAQEHVIAMIAPLRTAISGHWPEAIDWLASVGATLAENTIKPPVPTFKAQKSRRASP